VATATRDNVQSAQRFLDALSTRDWAGIRACLAPDARLRALVPSALRDDQGADAIVDRFRLWFGELEGFQLLDSATEEMADRVHVRYRLAGADPVDGPVVAEQQCYFLLEDGRIAAINSVCSGFRPAELLR
jgi:ketosteroid isomerase-like protein